MTRRPSVMRRLLGAIAAALCVVAGLGAVVVWTSTARVTSASGFADVTVATIQSPSGSEALTDALMDRVIRFTASRDITLTDQGIADIRGQIQQQIQASEFPGIIGPAIERARQAYEAAPDGPLSIDFAALRPRAEQRVAAIDPGLAKAIPPSGDLVVTVGQDDVPSVASDVVGAMDTVRWLPVWLLLGAFLFGALAFAASPARPRTARRLGIAFLAVALAPLLMRLALPPAAASFVDAGVTDVVSTATRAVLANWWIALIVSAGVGAALVGLSARSSRRPARRVPPVVLGG
jgi:hypothetical protein